MASYKKRNRVVRDTYRILDANFNRAKEGLRVCEEIARFHLKNKDITKELRALRHHLTAILNASSLDRQLLFKERDAHRDLGKKFTSQNSKNSFKGIFMANAQRIKEALRVLEEFLKLLDTTSSKKTQKLRFHFYALEKKTIEKFPALLDSR